MNETGEMEDQSTRIETHAETAQEPGPQIEK
jgi:hypothetical protein